MLRNANNGPTHSREKTRQIVARVYENITIIFNWQDKSHCLTVKQTVFSFGKLISCLVCLFGPSKTQQLNFSRACERGSKRDHLVLAVPAHNGSIWHNPARNTFTSVSVWFHEFFKVTFRISVSGFFKLLQIWVWSVNFPDFFQFNFWWIFIIWPNCAATSASPWMAGSPSFRLFSLYHHTVGPEGLNLFLKSRTILKNSRNVYLLTRRTMLQIITIWSISAPVGL